MIPPEIQLRIFEFLDYDTLDRVIQTCKYWHRMGSSDSLWMPLTRSRFVFKEHPLVYETWKEQFIALMIESRKHFSYYRSDLVITPFFF